MSKYPSKVKDELNRGDTGPQARDFQKAINKILVDHRFKWRRVKVDGVLGPGTLRSANFAAWILGLSRPQLRNIADKGRVTVHAQKLIRREKSRTVWQKRNQQKRYVRMKELRDAHNSVDPDGDGLAVFEGVTVAAWIKPWLEKAREEGWSGHVTSGWRSPEYSQSLCYQMCGAPSCPGKCAGLSSNHVGKGDKNGDPGAVDVTDYTNFGNIMARLGSPLHNSIGPSDPVHFSAAGN